MVLLEKEPKVLVVVLVSCLLVLFSACTVDSSDANALGDITGQAVRIQVTPVSPPGTDFECWSDSDCGTDTFIGNTFCKDGDVYGRYRDYECLSAIDFSDCSSRVYDKIIEVCDETRGDSCVAGINYCVPEFEEAQARFLCAVDSDCGDDGLRDRSFCYDGDVYDYDVVYECDNRFCSAERETVLIEECPDYCDEGQCSLLPPGIECTVASDCGDSGYTETICRNGAEMAEKKTYSCIANTCLYSSSFILVKKCDSKMKETCVDGEGCVNYDLQNGYIKPGPVEITNFTTNFTTPNIIGTGSTQESVDSSSQDSTKPIESKQIKAVGAECVVPSDCGQDGFSGMPICLDNNVLSSYVTWSCDDGFCNNAIEDKVMESCSKYQYCSKGYYSCINKEVDLAINEVLVVPGEPFIIGEYVDIYLQIENLGYEDTFFGLDYELEYPDSSVKKQHTDAIYAIDSRETKTIFVITEKADVLGEHKVKFALSSSKQEYIESNNVAESSINVFGQESECVERNFLGICTRVTY